MFPAKYKNAAIIAEHSSWNRSTPSGYRVMAAFTDGRKVMGYEPFLDGFLPGSASTLPDAARWALPAAARPTRCSCRMDPF
jgi:glucose/arabinose dehydrogenase